MGAQTPERQGIDGMVGSVGRLLVAASLLVPEVAMAQSGAGVSGQQNNQPSANQNQSQGQTDNNQQPPNAKVLPPTENSQNQPNPLPQLAK